MFMLFRKKSIYDYRTDSLAPQHLRFCVKTSYTLIYLTLYARSP